MRSSFNLLTRDTQQCVVVIVEQGLFRFTTSLGIDALTNQQRWGVLLQGYCTDAAGDKGQRDAGKIFVIQGTICDWTGPARRITTRFDDGS